MNRQRPQKSGDDYSPHTLPLQTRSDVTALSVQWCCHVSQLWCGNPQAGWHREVPSREVVTPTMDALVKEGVELNRHCTSPRVFSHNCSIV